MGTHDQAWFWFQELKFFTELKLSYHVKNLLNIEVWKTANTSANFMFDCWFLSILSGYDTLFVIKSGLEISATLNEYVLSCEQQ
jgi:hypothetical protein